MKVVCKVQSCWYHSNNGFCTKPLVFLNGNGSCERIYDNQGRVRPNWNNPPEQPQQEKKERIKEITDEKME